MVIVPALKVSVLKVAMIQCNFKAKGKEKGKGEEKGKGKEREREQKCGDFIFKPPRQK
jgi:hypothetical protein